MWYHQSGKIVSTDTAFNGAYIGLSSDGNCKPYGPPAPAPPAPPAPRNPYCVNYHPIHDGNVYDPSGKQACARSCVRFFQSLAGAHLIHLALAEQGANLQLLVCSFYLLPSISSTRIRVSPPPSPPSPPSPLSPTPASAQRSASRRDWIVAHLGR